MEKNLLLGRKRLRLISAKNTNTLNNDTFNTINDTNFNINMTNYSKIDNWYMFDNYIQKSNDSKITNKKQIIQKEPYLSRFLDNEDTYLPYIIESYSSFIKDNNPEFVIDKSINNVNPHKKSKKLKKLDLIERENNDKNLRESDLLLKNKKWLVNNESARYHQEYIMFKLKKPSVVKYISFYKFAEDPTLAVHFKIFVGLSKSRMIHIITSGLTLCDDDTEFESFQIKIKNMFLPCRYIKLVPIKPLNVNYCVGFSKIYIFGNSSKECYSNAYSKYKKELRNEIFKSTIKINMTIKRNIVMSSYKQSFIDKNLIMDFKQYAETIGGMNNNSDKENYFNFTLNYFNHIDLKIKDRSFDIRKLFLINFLKHTLNSSDLRNDVECIKNNLVIITVVFKYVYFILNKLNYIKSKTSNLSKIKMKTDKKSYSYDNTISKSNSYIRNSKSTFLIEYIDYYNLPNKEFSLMKRHSNDYIDYNDLLINNKQYIQYCFISEKIDYYYYLKDFNYIQEEVFFFLHAFTISELLIKKHYYTKVNLKQLSQDSYQKDLLFNKICMDEAFFKLSNEYRNNGKSVNTGKTTIDLSSLLLDSVYDDIEKNISLDKLGISSCYFKYINNLYNWVFNEEHINKKVLLNINKVYWKLIEKRYNKIKDRKNAMMISGMDDDKIKKTNRKTNNNCSHDLSQFTFNFKKYLIEIVTKKHSNSNISNADSNVLNENNDRASNDLADNLGINNSIIENAENLGNIGNTGNNNINNNINNDTIPEFLEGDISDVISNIEYNENNANYGLLDTRRPINSNRNNNISINNNPFYSNIFDNSNFNLSSHRFSRYRNNPRINNVLNESIRSRRVFMSNNNINPPQGNRASNNSIDTLRNIMMRENRDQPQRLPSIDNISSVDVSSVTVTDNYLNRLEFYARRNINESNLNNMRSKNNRQNNNYKNDSSSSSSVVLNIDNNLSNINNNIKEKVNKEKEDSNSICEIMAEISAIENEGEKETHNSNIAQKSNINVCSNHLPISKSKSKNSIEKSKKRKKKQLYKPKYSFNEIHSNLSSANNIFKFSTTNKLVRLIQEYEEETSLPHKYPQGRGGHAIAIDEKRNKIYIHGGRNKNEDLNDFWVYDIILDTWKMISKDTRIEVGPEPKSLHKMVYVKELNKLYLFGGYEKDEIRSYYYTYDFVSRLWEKINYIDISIKFDNNNEDDGALDSQMLTSQFIVLKSNLSSFNMISYKDKIVFYGGKDSYKNGIRRPFGMYIFNCFNNSMKLLYDSTLHYNSNYKVMNRYSNSFCYNSINNTFLIFGGITHVEESISIPIKSSIPEIRSEFVEMAFREIKKRDANNLLTNANKKLVFINEINHNTLDKLSNHRNSILGNDIDNNNNRNNINNINIINNSNSTIDKDVHYGEYIKKKNLFSSYNDNDDLSYFDNKYISDTEHYNYIIHNKKFDKIHKHYNINRNMNNNYNSNISNNSYINNQNNQSNTSNIDINIPYRLKASDRLLNTIKDSFGNKTIEYLKDSYELNLSDFFVDNKKTHKENLKYYKQRIIKKAIDINLSVSCCFNPLKNEVMYTCGAVLSIVKISNRIWFYNFTNQEWYSPLIEFDSQMNDNSVNFKERYGQGLVFSNKLQSSFIFGGNSNHSNSKRLNDFWKIEFKDVCIEESLFRVENIIRRIVKIDDSVNKRKRVKDKKKENPLKGINYDKEKIKLLVDEEEQQLNQNNLVKEANRLIKEMRIIEKEKNNKASNVNIKLSSETISTKGNLANNSKNDINNNLKALNYISLSKDNENSIEIIENKNYVADSADCNLYRNKLKSLFSDLIEYLEIIDN